MKKICIATAGAFAALLLAVVLWAGLFPPASLSARAASFYAFSIPQYHVEMDVGADRKIAIEEEISVRFHREGQSGIIRDLPLDRGVRYGDFSATRNGENIVCDFRSEVSDMISLYLGEAGGNLSTQSTYLYRIRYTMTVPALAEEGYLPLDLLGQDWQAPVSAFSATVRIPDGLRDFAVYGDGEILSEKTGNVITVSREGTWIGSGLTLDLSFRAGVLQSAHDPIWIWAVVCVGGALVLFLLLKLFVRDPILVRTVNLTAPDKMDPLRMGKLIDGVVDDEDIGALIYYFAAEGYLDIDLRDEDDPLLTMTGKLPPADAPEHIRIFFEGLFHRREKVRVSELRYGFYPTAERTKTALKKSVCKMYKTVGTVCTVLLGVIATLLFGGVALLVSARRVSPMYGDWSVAIVSAAAYLIAALVGSAATFRRFKWKRGVPFLCRLGSFLLGCCPILIGLFTPHLAFGLSTVVIFGAGAAALGTLSTFYRVRTEEYNALLEQILGFKDFIEFTEKDKIAFMLKDDPALFYRILPYAQVLGVTDAWTDKFATLTLEPPAWISYSVTDALIDALAFRTIFRVTSLSMGKTFVTRRPVNFGGGYNGGGFGGGFSGGGFGGGGGRSF